MADSKENLEENEKKKKDSKGKADLNEQDEEEESVGSKIGMFFMFLLIIAIWLGIIAILIKCDVGEFGSSVLTPILKDVPVINRVLPNYDQLVSTETDEYKYDSIDEAIARIKELEKELDELTASGSKNSKKIKELNEEIEKLQKYKQEQVEFEKVKEKFYEEVVFSNEAPDINEYKTYYESIDPENAEVLYKRVIEQLESDKKIQDYASTYASMKPKEAAAIFNTMTKDLKLVAQILMAMDTQDRANILGKMDAEIAAKITEIMNPK